MKGSLSAYIVATAMWLAACGAGSPPMPSPGGGQDVRLEPDTLQVRGVVPRSATLDAMLRAQGLADGASRRLIDAMRPVFDPRRLRSLQPFLLVRTLEGAFRHFEYEIDGDSFLRIVPTGFATDALRAEVLPIPKTLEHAAVSGTIGGDTPSLFQAMEAAGERPELSIALAEIFGGEIDFNSDLQPGDRFALAFERFRREGRPASYGLVTAAEFRNDGRLIRAIRFTPPGGKADYFDEEGRSLRRFFLRSPLKFEPRITSRFSSGRAHPILHVTRAHNGVDYGAPQGAPVVAVAAGTVVSATFDVTNGRMIRLRHSSGYESNYLHLSAFAAEVRAGVRVEQGELIGRVGATGLATGPHLHYALRKNGAFVNPLREQQNLPPGDPIPASAIDAFVATRDMALGQLTIQ
ncbi:MAG: M23 family metallopeptidase [Vicinamibacterales bacterium]